VIHRPTLLSLALLVGALATHAPRGAAPDRRVVDTVHAGDAVSEAAHGYVGIDARADSAGGVPHREARGWMRYALTTFDDTEVTVSCTFAASTGAQAADVRRFDLVVEDSVVAAHDLAPAAEPRTVNIVVPMSLTRGKTNIAVIIRARDGVTPSLQLLRTVQDHNEQPTFVPNLVSYPLGATR
jgi:hypothetical protein